MRPVKGFPRSGAVGHDLHAASNPDFSLPHVSLCLGVTSKKCQNINCIYGLLVGVLET